MKAYVFENEFWPCYSVTTRQDEAYEHEIDVSEEVVLDWRRISREFFQMQREVEQAITQYKLKKEEVDHLKYCFAKTNPSRQDKGYILTKFGWTQIDTSLWEKDGRQMRLHDAYNECKNIFLEQNPVEQK